MLRIAVVGFNKLTNLLFLNMPSWHGQVKLFVV